MLPKEQGSEGVHSVFAGASHRFHALDPFCQHRHMDRCSSSGHFWHRRARQSGFSAPCSMPKRPLSEKLAPARHDLVLQCRPCDRCAPTLVRGVDGEKLGYTLSRDAINIRHPVIQPHGHVICVPDHAGTFAGVTATILNARCTPSPSAIVT